MKKIIIIFVLFFAMFYKSDAQTPAPDIRFTTTSQMTTYSGSFMYATLNDSVIGGHFYTVFGSFTPDNLDVFATGVAGRYWKRFRGGTTVKHAGGPFTTENIHVLFNPGTNLTADEIIDKVWYGLKPPTATLTGGTTLEYTAASTVSQTLNWGAGRQSNTPTLSTIVVAGTSQSFAQPAQGATVSGTQVVAVPSNTSTTYTNLVTASDGQTDAATTQFIFQPRKYYGWISDTTGIASGSQDAVILALTSTLSSSKTLGVPTPYGTGSPSGTQFFVYAYLSSLGSISSIMFNGIPADEAMTTISKSLTTANTYVGTYTIIYNKQGQTASSTVIFQ